MLDCELLYPCILYFYFHGLVRNSQQNTPFSHAAVRCKHLITAETDIEDS